MTPAVGQQRPTTARHQPTPHRRSSSGQLTAQHQRTGMRWSRCAEEGARQEGMRECGVLTDAATRTVGEDAGAGERCAETAAVCRCEQSTAAGSGVLSLRDHCPRWPTSKLHYPFAASSSIPSLPCTPHSPPHSPTSDLATSLLPSLTLHRCAASPLSSSATVTWTRAQQQPGPAGPALRPPSLPLRRLCPAPPPLLSRDGTQPRGGASRVGRLFAALHGDAAAAAAALLSSHAAHQHSHCRSAPQPTNGHSTSPSPAHPALLCSSSPRLSSHDAPLRLLRFDLLLPPLAPPRRSRLLLRSSPSSLPFRRHG